MFRYPVGAYNSFVYAINDVYGIDPENPLLILASQDDVTSTETLEKFRKVEVEAQLQQDARRRFVTVVAVAV